MELMQIIRELLEINIQLQHIHKSISEINKKKSPYLAR